MGAFLMLPTVGALAQREARDTSDRPISLPAFDQPVDPDKYIIRPGERFLVTPVGGGIPPVILVVDPEGRIIDPKMGVVDVFGKTLTQIRALLSAPLSQQYRAERIIVSVQGPRVVPIRVNGAVNNPGTYSAATSQRVSDIIRLAGGLKPSASIRHIQFIGGPKSIRVDFQMAASGLGMEFDPPLYAGSTVMVPVQTGEKVQVVGEVQNPKDIEFVEGESVGTVILLAGGALPSGDLSRLDLSVNVRPGEQIIVPIRSDLVSSGGLAVIGGVMHPGSYAYTSGTSIEQLITLAGGTIPTANLSRVVIFRRCDRQIPGADTLAHSVISDLREANGEFRQFALNPFDTLVIPRRVGWVKVSGQVGMPGTVPFTEGKPASFYIQAAGSYVTTPELAKIIIRHRLTEEILPASPAFIVSDGDEIVVSTLESRP